MSACCVMKSVQVCSGETPGHRGVIDFSGGRISFQFGSAGNQTDAAVLCGLERILSLVTATFTFGREVPSYRYSVSVGFFEKLTGKTMAVSVAHQDLKVT